jgi:hypothetical protein
MSLIAAPGMVTVYHVFAVLVLVLMEIVVPLMILVMFIVFTRTIFDCYFVIIGTVFDVFNEFNGDSACFADTGFLVGGISC